MKRIIGITATLICSLFFQSPVIAQEATANPSIIKTKPVFEKPIKKDFKPSIKIKKAIEFFKFADELQLTDDQIIKLRAFYKKYNSQKPEIKEPKKALNMLDFYKMTDEELVKYADEEAMKKKQVLMFKLQKIIEIRKILSKDQLDLIQKEAENRRKEFEDKKAKNRHSRKPITSRKFMMPPMCCPQMGMIPQSPMMPKPHQPHMMSHHNMPPMCCPQMGMMPQSPMMPMPHQPHMMFHHNMPPMCCPQMGMIPQSPMMPMPHQFRMMSHHNMPPMCCPQMGMMPQSPMMSMPNQPHMMSHHNMPPMGCPQMGMIPQSPMKPMPKFDKQNKDKQPKHKFAPQNHFPMMNPMGFCPSYMGQTNMMGCCQCHKRPHIPGFRKNIKEKRPPFDFLMKLFSCKKEKDSDIINNDKENKSEKANKNQPKVPLANEEKK